MHYSRQQCLVAEWSGHSVTVRVRVRARARKWNFSLFFFVCVKMWQTTLSCSPGMVYMKNNSTIVIMSWWCKLGNGGMENQPKVMASRSDKNTQHTQWSSWSQRSYTGLFLLFLADTKSQHASASCPPVSRAWLSLQPLFSEHLLTLISACTY